MFRGWNKKTNKYVYGYLYSEHLSNSPLYYIIVPSETTIHAGGIIAEHDSGLYCVEEDSIGQCTGLKDRYRKEIYNGDILEFDAKEWGSDKSNKFIVTWNERHGEWNTGGGANNECSEYKTIIGNIYENPELIKNCAK